MDTHLDFDRAGPFCLGCMNFGTRVTEDAAYPVLDRFLERGGRFLDTANNYSFWQPNGQGGESEQLLGRWLKSRGCRDDVALATKVGANPTVAGTGFETAEGLGAAAIERAIAASLERLATDRVDLYYAHVDDRSVPLEDTLLAFNGVVDAGQARAIGASNFRAWRLALALDVSARHRLARYVAIQQRFSYLQPAPGADLDVQVVVNDDLLDLCQATNTTLFAYSPLLSGAYTRNDVPLRREYRTVDNARRLEALRRVADAAGATPNQVVLAWLRQGSAVPVIPVIAASTVAQLDESLDAADLRLTDDELETLGTAGSC